MQPDRRAHARHAGTDDDDLKGVEYSLFRSVAPDHAARVDGGGAQILLHHFDIVGANRRAGGGRQHVDEQLATGDWRKRSRMPGKVHQHLEQLGADLGAHHRGHHILIT